MSEGASGLLVALASPSGAQVRSVTSKYPVKPVWSTMGRSPVSAAPKKSMMRASASILMARAL